MKIGLRVIAAVLSPFLVGLYAALLTYYFRDPARPFGFMTEYLLGILFSLVLNVLVVIWVSIGIDQITRKLGLFNWRGYFFRIIAYTCIGYLPVIISWLTSSNPEASLFYPQATFYPVASLIYLHVLLGLNGLLSLYGWIYQNQRLQ